MSINPWPSNDHVSHSRSFFGLVDVFSAWSTFFWPSSLFWLFASATKKGKKRSHWLWNWLTVFWQGLTVFWRGLTVIWRGWPYFGKGAFQGEFCKPWRKENWTQILLSCWIGAILVWRWITIYYDSAPYTINAWQALNGYTSVQLSGQFLLRWLANTHVWTFCCRDLLGSKGYRPSALVTGLVLWLLKAAMPGMALQGLANSRDFWSGWRRPNWTRLGVVHSAPHCFI